MLYSFHSKWTLKSCIEFKSLIIFRSPCSEFEFRVAIFICVHPISCLFFSIHFLKPCKLEYKSYTSSIHVLYFLLHATYFALLGWCHACIWKNRTNSDTKSSYLPKFGTHSKWANEQTLRDQLFTVNTIWNIGETGDMYTTAL